MYSRIGYQLGSISKKHDLINLAENPKPRLRPDVVPEHHLPLLPHLNIRQQLRPYLYEKCAIER
jgi:hypothetical protein